MSEIRSTISLYDNFSGVIDRIANAVNHSVLAMERIQASLKKPIDDTALRGARASADNMNAAIHEMNEAVKGARGDIESFAGSVDGIGNTAQGVRNDIESLTGAVEGAAEAAQRTEEASRGLGDVLGDVGDNGKDAASDINSTADSVDQLLQAVGGYKVLEFVKNSFIEASSAAMEFESAVAGIYKTVDGTQAELQGLSDDVMALALRIPATTTEIAGVMENAGQLGIETSAITDFTQTMISLGEATNLSSDAAASALAKFANVTGMSQENFSNLGSVIVDLGNNFATTEADITNMSSYLASAATLAGFAETDILALSAAMSSVGIEAEAGGSAMSKLITQMQIAVETGSGSLEDFASTADMTMDEFVDTFQNDAVGALQAFITGLNDVERNGASASVILQRMDLDDIRLSNTIRALASSGELMSDAVKTASQAWEENSALTDEAEKRYSTLESKLQITRNAADNLKTAVGTSLNPILEDLSGAATAVIEKITDFFKCIRILRQDLWDFQV